MVPTSYSTSILFPPIDHLTLLFLSLGTSSNSQSSCSSASVHSLQSGPQIAEEKESSFSAPSRFKSEGAGEYIGGGSGEGRGGRDERF